MSECYGNSFIRNGELTPGVLFSNAEVYEGESVYEVIRMMNGTPLFFDDHMERMENSVAYHGRTMLASRQAMADDLIRLRKDSGIKEANLKIVHNFKESGNTYLLYFIEPLYPTPQQYRDGVNTILYHAERENPGVKVINHRLRSSIYHRLIATNAYEALLVDSDGFITEGSRSNIFFLSEGKLFTAPDSKVLGGITRKHVLDICRANNFQIRFECIHFETIHKFESVFMTGTSPMVLSVRRIDDIAFSTENPLIRRLLELYMVRVRESISAFRRPRGTGRSAKK